MEQAKKTRLPTEQEARILAEKYLKLSGDFEYRLLSRVIESKTRPSFLSDDTKPIILEQETFAELRCLNRFGEVRQTTIRFFEDSLEIWEEDQGRYNKLTLKLPYDKYTFTVRFN